MDSQLELKLIECLSRLDDGESIERILAGYPDDAAGLRPLLETATALADMRTPPPETVRIASRRAFLAQAHQLRESAARQRPWLIRRMAIAFTALIAAVVFLSGTVAASASALPSEPLYGVKRAVEDAQLLVASGTEKQRLAASFGQRRRDEISQLLAMRRDTAIAFEGTIEIIRPNGWEISGLYIYFDQTTTVAGTPQLGSYVHIQGHTEAGRLLADSVSIEPGRDSSIIPAAMATATAVPSAIPSQLPSPSQQTASQPLASPTATLAPTQAPTAVPTARSTAAPRPRPTATPAIAIPPTSIPPTQEDDHGGNSGEDVSGGNAPNPGSGSDTSGPGQPGGDTSNSGPGSDDHGGDSNSGSNSGDDSSGHGGDDQGGNDHGGGNDHKP